MPVFTPTTATGPREELSRAIVEGEGQVRGCIGQLIMPDFPLTARTAHLPKLTLANTLAMRLIADKKFYRAPGTHYQRMTAQVSDFTLSTNFQAVEIVVPNEEEATWDQYMSLVAFFVARGGSDWSKLTKEYLVAQTVFNVSSTFQGSATNSSAAYTVANRDILGPLGMNPIQDIIAAVTYLKGLGERPDFVAMSWPVWTRVSTCQNTLQFVRGIFAGITEVNLENFGDALKAYGIQDVWIGDAYYNNAQDQDTPNLQQLWSNTYMAVGRRGMASAGDAGESADVGVPTLGGLGITPWWQNFTRGGAGTIATGEGTVAGGMGNFITTYIDQTINSMVVRVSVSANPTITNNRCLTLIATQYA